MTIELDLTQFGLTYTRKTYWEEPANWRERNECHLRAYFAGEEQKPYVIEEPATWWEHFKRDWLPAWALRRWPARLQSRELTIKTIYLFLQTKLPPNLWGPRVMVMVNDETLGSFVAGTKGLSRLEVLEEAHAREFDDWVKRDMHARPPKP